MKKILKILVLSILVVLVSLFLIFTPFIFQEGNPIPVVSGLLKLSKTGNSFAKLDEHKYIVKASETDIKKLKEYLAQSNLVYVDQMGSGLLFKGKNGVNHTATIRMYTTSFEIWDFSNQTKPGLILP